MRFFFVAQGKLARKRHVFSLVLTNEIVAFTRYRDVRDFYRGHSK